MNAATPARTTVRRNPKRARYDQDSIYRVLDRGRVAYVGFCADGQPHCVPTLYARAGDEVLIHGSSASRMIQLPASGAPACLTVTILDGLVLARSAFEHSANYDSVVLLVRFRAVSTDEQKHAPRPADPADPPGDPQAVHRAVPATEPTRNAAEMVPMATSPSGHYRWRARTLT